MDINDPIFILLYDLQKATEKKYRSENFEFIREMDVSKFGRPDNDVALWFIDTVRKCNTAHQRNSYWAQPFDDLIISSEECAFFLAQMLLYRPFIDNPTENPVQMGSRIVYPSLESFYDKRYITYGSTAYEKLYNFWDRIGDLIWSFFPARMPEKSVFFPIMIDKVPAQFHSSVNYQWLKTFRDTRYAIINDERKMLVHYLTASIRLKYEHLEISGKTGDNYDDFIGLQKKREDIPVHIRAHLVDTVEGFARTLLFLNEVNLELYP